MDATTIAAVTAAIMAVVASMTTAIISIIQAVRATARAETLAQVAQVHNDAVANQLSTVQLTVDGRLTTALAKIDTLNEKIGDMTTQRSIQQASQPPTPKEPNAS